jgi:hypothetical protein
MMPEEEKTRLFTVSKIPFHFLLTSLRRLKEAIIVVAILRYPL